MNYNVALTFPALANQADGKLLGVILCWGGA
jgi:hypothetical protein